MTTYWRSVGLRTLGAVTLALSFVSLLSYGFATGFAGRSDEEVLASDWPLYLAAAIAVGCSIYVLVRGRSAWKTGRYFLGVAAMIAIPMFVDMVVRNFLQLPAVLVLLGVALLVPLRGDVMPSEAG